MIKFGTYVASIAVVRDRTIRALQHSEERYLTLFKSIEAAFCVLERIDGDEVDFRLLEANPMFEKITGLTSAVGQTIRGIVPALSPDWLITLDRVAVTGEHTRADKSLGNRWFQLYCYRVDRPEEQRVAVLMDDITGRKRSERNLKYLASASQTLTKNLPVATMMHSAAESLGTFLNLSSCGIAEMDEAGKIAATGEWATKAAAGTCLNFVSQIISSEDYSARFNDGKCLVIDDTNTGQMEPSAPAGVRALMAVPIAKNDHCRLCFIVCQDAPHAWGQDEIDLVASLAGRLWARLERARTEEALWNSERKLRQIFEGAKEYAIFSVDTAGHFSSWSPGAERVFGYATDEVLDKHLELIFTPQDRAEQVPRQDLMRALAEGVAENERWFQRKDGSCFYGSGLTQPISDHGGQHVGFTTICRDRTADHQAREWLEWELVDIQRLQNASARLVAAGDFSSLLTKILQAAIAITRADAGTVQLIEGDKGNVLRLLASEGLDDHSPNSTYTLAPEDENSCSEAIRAGERVVIEDFEKGDFLKSPLHEKLAKAGIRAGQWTPLISRSGRLLGMLATHWWKMHQPGERELRLLDLLARQAADLIERHQSEAALRDFSQTLERRVMQRTAELNEQKARLQNLAAELASAEQRERKRLAALLHDDLQQLLVAAGMQLGIAVNHMDESSISAVKQAAKWIEEAKNAARDLTRQLRPPALYEEGLVAALNWLSGEMRKRHHLKIVIDGSEPVAAMSDAVKALLFECIRELLFNTAKYSGVNEATVKLTETSDLLSIIVEDYGAGFDVASISNARQSEGFGLFSIRERLAALGGQMSIVSSPGEGTRIELKAPFPGVPAIAEV